MATFPGDFYFINEKQNLFKKKLHRSALPLEKCLDLKESNLISLMTVC